MTDFSPLFFFVFVVSSIFVSLFSVFRKRDAFFLFVPSLFVRPNENGSVDRVPDDSLGRGFVNVPVTVSEQHDTHLVPVPRTVGHHFPFSRRQGQGTCCTGVRPMAGRRLPPLRLAQHGTKVAPEEGQSVTVSIFGQTWHPPGADPVVETKSA